MKTLIFQVAVGEVPNFYNICTQSVKRYAERINSDYKILTEPELKIKPFNSQRSTNALRLGFLPIFEKEFAFNYLDDYDAICIIDSDIFVREDAPNIFDEIDDSIPFAGVYEKDMPLTPQYINKIKAYSKNQYQPLYKEVGGWPRDPFHGYIFFNMGVMLFTPKLKDYLNGHSPEEFIRRPEFERFVNGEGHWRWSTDQTMLNYWIQKSKMKTKALNWRWNALFKGIKDELLPDAYFMHFFLSANLPRKGGEIPEIIADLDKAKHIREHR